MDCMHKFTVHVRMYVCMYVQLYVYDICHDSQVLCTGCLVINRLYLLSTCAV